MPTTRRLLLTSLGGACLAGAVLAPGAVAQIQGVWPGPSAASATSGGKCKPGVPRLGNVNFSGRVVVDVSFDMDQGRTVEVVSITGAEGLDERNRKEVEKTVRDAVMETTCPTWEEGRRRMSQRFAFRITTE